LYHSVNKNLLPQYNQNIVENSRGDNHIYIMVISLEFSTIDLIIHNSKGKIGNNDPVLGCKAFEMEYHTNVL
jgi:hypothetical protein